MRSLKNLLIGLSGVVMLAGCSASGDNPGWEYAPNMYHSVPYEPYKQIVDKDAGRWLTSIDYPDGHAEFYNSNNFNPHRMNLRAPAPNTVKRNPQGWLPYRLPNTDEGLAQASQLKSPLEDSEKVISEGKALYEMYCDHCHGAKGEGEWKGG